MVIPIIIAVLVLFSIVAIRTYNNVISKKNLIDNAEGSVNVALKKRHELIPHLTACAQYDQEQQQLRLDKLADITKGINMGEFSQQRMTQEGEVSLITANILSDVSQVQNESILHLQHTWTEMEEQISASRRFYNTAIAQYNTAIESFPGTLVAGYLKLERRRKYDIPMSQKFATNDQLNK